MTGPQADSVTAQGGRLRSAGGAVDVADFVMVESKDADRAGAVNLYGKYPRLEGHFGDMERPDSAQESQ